MATFEASDSTPFNVIQHDPSTSSAASSSRQRTIAPSESFSTPLRLHPYSRAPSTTTSFDLTANSSSIASGSVVAPGDAPTRRTRDRVRMSDVDPDDHPAIAWARSYMIKDLVNTYGWMKHDTKAEKKALDSYLVEIIAQANTLFRRSKCQAL